MKKFLILVFSGSIMLFIATSITGAPDGYCEGKGAYATQHGVYAYWCPHENATSSCFYKKPSSGCPAAVGGGGAN